MARSARRGGGVFADLPELETERLLLRKMHLDDAQAMFSYASDPEVTRYVLWETHPLVEDSERGEFGGWSVVLKGSGAFVGTCGVDVGYAPEHARAELGYVLSREH